jgi:hypothetical protein
MSLIVSPVLTSRTSTRSLRSGHQRKVTVPWNCLLLG